MKLLEAYIPPEALDQVRQSLANLGLDDLVTSETAAVTQKNDRSRWESYTEEFVPQLKLEFAVRDDQAKAVAHQILGLVANRREAAACRILIEPLDDVIRIETGERGRAAM
jgi:nitrogen regulatory protein PII